MRTSYDSAMNGFAVQTERHDVVDAAGLLT